MFYDFVTLPEATTTFANIGVWSSEMFDNLDSIAWLIIGVGVGSILIAALISLVPDAFSWLIRRKKKDYD